MMNNWDIIEAELTGIRQTLEHRCYSAGSKIGIRYIMRLVREGLLRVDGRLLVIEGTEKMNLTEASEWGKEPPSEEE